MSSTHVISQQVDHTPIFTNAVKRTLQDKLRDTISVKDFGAVGDGVTDDAPAIQAAISTGKSVYIPIGTYVIRSTIIISVSGQMVYGDGVGVTILSAPIANQPALWIKGDYANSNSNNIPRHIKVSDLRITGTGSSGTSVGIEIGQCAAITIDNIRVGEFASHGIYLKRPNHLFNIELNGVHSISNGGYGLYCDSSSPVYLLNMYNCYISANAIGAAYLYYVGASINGCAFAGSPVGVVIKEAFNGVLAGCNFEGNSGTDIQINSAQQLTILSPRFISAGSSISPVSIASTGSSTRQIDILNSRFVAYDLSAAGKHVFSIADGAGITIGKYYLESCNMGGNAEVTFGSGYLGASFGNTYWDTTINNWAYAFGEMRGNWTPSFTGLTVVNGTGAATYSGTYVRIGHLVKWSAIIVISGTCTTSSVAGATVITNLPFTPSSRDTCTAVSAGVASYGVGAVFNAGTVVYTPSWGAVNAGIIISGSFEVA